MSCLLLFSIVSFATNVGIVSSVPEDNNWDTRIHTQRNGTTAEDVFVRNGGKYLNITNCERYEMASTASQNRSVGLRLCVFNQRSGEVIFHKIFPLYQFYAIWEDLVRHMKNISPERIVVLQMDGSSSIGLRNAVDLLEELGSVFVTHLNPHANWIWVFVNFGKTIYEEVVMKHSKKERDPDSSSHIFLSLSDVPLPRAESETEKNRWEFCSKYGVMGDLCDESSPAKFNDINLRLRENRLLKSVPVIITAGKRTSYLYQSLKSYLRSEGVVFDNFHVYLGSNVTQTISFLNLFGINYTVISSADYNSTEFSSFLYYRKVYESVLSKYANSTYVIFLEEDVEISPDFFSYISQTMILLTEDATLYCITGYSLHGLKYRGHDKSMLYRSNMQPSWGYATTLSFVKEALDKWPTEGVTDDTQYDAWIYATSRKGRECIVPEVGLSLHFGIGINTIPWVDEKFFLSTKLSNEFENIKFENIDRLEKSKWNQYLRDEISNARPVKGNPCKKKFVARLHLSSYVIYYNLNFTDRDTHLNYMILHNCFDMWSISTLGQHDYVTYIRVSQNSKIYLVAFPESPFADLKPSDYAPFDIWTQSSRERDVYLYSYSQRSEYKPKYSGKNSTAGIYDLFQ